jgi:DNA-binding PadR family transcriptional regulator
MREVVIEMLKSRPMDGSDLFDLLRKSNVKLKGASGEGEIFGLLRELEKEQLIEEEEKNDGRERYRLTSLGRTEGKRSSRKAVDLGRWLLGRSIA